MALSLDQIFSTTLLNLLVPDTSIEFPPTISTDSWLEKARTKGRRQAFFDEHLQSILVLRIKSSALERPDNSTSPPEILLDMLAHIQVALEASYISSQPTTAEPRTSGFLQTPRTGSLARPNNRLNTHPSILPPTTPNPLPSTGEQDRKYTTSEGTILVANIWGSNTAEDSTEAFALLWSEAEECWIAVYRMVITVSFLRLTFINPLLCLTVSATLRDKPIPTHPKHPLTVFLTSIGGKRFIAPESPIYPEQGIQEDDPQLLDGLEEINLLEGLLAGSTFGKPGAAELNLPSLRLGTASREKLFSLPPVLADTPVQASPSPMTAVRRAHPTLRKSYRKTLQTASGFRVRMRTVFVPYVLLPETEGTIEDLDEEEKEKERREAGNEERTVVLCVEIENYGDSGTMAGFMVEKVDVSIGGEGAKATLIGWADQGFTANAAKETFPLRIGSQAQYNLLYAVTFMRSPEEIDSFSFARKPSESSSTPELQRAVTINIFGKPYFPPSSSSRPLIPDTDTLLYPTQTFSSRWNCVLDLTAQQNQPTDIYDPNDPTLNYPSVLPEPASPFPAFAMYSSNTTPGMYSADSTPQYSATAGSRRFTLVPGRNFSGRTLKNITPSKSFLRPNDIGREQSPFLSSRPLSHIGMSNPASAAQYLRSPTTYSAPPPPPMPLSILPIAGLPQAPDSEDGRSGMPTDTETPITPAYPAFPSKSALPPTPMSQRPVALTGSGNVGYSVEIRRERGVGAGGGELGSSAQTQTPLPFVSGAFGEQKMLAKLQEAGASGENIVVSVGLLPIPNEQKRRDEVVLGPGKIYPLGIFTLDIFVFNQSLWPRRFEVTCPDKRRRKRGGVETGVYEGGTEAARKMGYPGVLPLESRIRIGPLRPSACQSVRMNFLAVSPGVHSIDCLTLTDIESGFTTNLRSVLDIVVHDPRD